MPSFDLTFYEARFHKITVDAVDAVEAEVYARAALTANAGFGRSSSRGLVRWHVEATDSSSSAQEKKP